jgi:hypothetical protein
LNRRSAAFGIASVVTLGGLLGALWLGAWAFDVRRFTTHRRRLDGLLLRSPSGAQIAQAFKDEGTRRLGRAESPASLAGFCARFAGRQAADIESGARRFAASEAYLAGDVVYFIHYDSSDVMRGFALVDARELRTSREAGR